MMFRFFINVFIYLSFAGLLVLNGSELNDSLKIQFDNFVKYNTGNIYNFNEPALKDNIRLLLKNNRIQAVKIDDVGTKNILWQAYKKENKVFIGEAFSQDIINLKSNKKDIVYKGKKIAEITFYFLQKSDTIDLSNEEKEWFNKQIDIKIAIQTKWIPLSYLQSDTPKGLSVDFIHLINKKLGGKLTIVPDNFKNSLDKLKDKQIDAMVDITPTKERQQYYLFTTPYMTIPHAILTNKNNPKKYKSETELNDVTMSVEKGFRTLLSVKESAPNAKFKIYENTLEAIDALSLGKVDAYVGNRAVANYVLHKRFITNLEFTTNVKRKGSVLAIGVNKDNKILRDILQKALNSISEDERKEIVEKYIGIGDEKSKFLKNLTEKEKNWIAKQETVRVTNEIDWAPFDYNEDGVPKGISIEILKLISKKTGLDFDFVTGNWTEIYEQFKEKKIDLIHPLIQNKDRKRFILFTKPHIQLNNVLIVRNTELNIKTLQDLNGKRLAVAKGWANHEKIMKNYPNIHYVEVNNTLEGLKAVAENRADAYSDAMTTAEHIIKTNFITNLKIIYDSATIKELGIMKLHLGIRKDWPILHRIIKKALDSITPQEMGKIYESFGLSFSGNKEKKIFFNKRESRWLEKNNNKIKICIDPNWMPIEKIDEQGKYIGISKDIYNLFEKRLGVSFELVPTESWNQSIKYAQQKKCDLLSFLQKTAKREKYLNFTSTMYQTPDIIVAKKDRPFIADLEELSGKKVGVIKGYAIEEKIKNEYPEIELVYIKSQLDGFSKVSKGELYAIIDTLLISAYNINLHGYQDLKIAGKLDVKNDYRIGVRDDIPELLSIMEKAVNSLSDTDMSQINSKWVSVEFEHKFDYSLLWKVLAVAVLLLSTIIYWNRKLAAEIVIRKQIEEDLKIAKAKAEQATQAKSMFLARMSHEIRTPMNAILGMLYLTQKTNLDPIQENYIHKAKHAADSLLYVINDILDFSKIESGKLSIEHVECDLNEIMAKIASIMNFKAEEKELELLIQYDPNIPQVIITDPVRLEQILLNLISNAIKFTSKGEVIISQHLKSEKDNILELEFCIQDSGIGITKEGQKKLFKDFSQVDESTTRKYGGSGLGLAIAKKLSQLLGGDIWLEKSVANDGSIFCFTIECKRATVQTPMQKIFPESLKNLKTLIVDDNKIACEILSDILDSLHLHNDKVYSGEEALDLILNEEKSYDIIFLDYKLEGIDGIEVYKRLEETLKDDAPKVIMISAYAQDEVIENFKKEGIQSFLTKPVQPSLLFDTVLHLLGKTQYLTEDLKTDAQNQSISLDSIKGAQILLAEDNELNQEFVQVLLNTNGLDVDIANDGVEALKMVQLKKYDLVLMDIQMPNMDGLESARQIRNLDSENFKTLPIVALSAHAMIEDVKKSLDAGMDDHVIKPINPDQLFEVFLHFIEPKQNKSDKEDLSKTKKSIFENQSSTLIDYQNGLYRVGNNEQGYLKIIKSFAKRYKSFFDDLKKFLDGSELNEAEKKIHEIKGISGNIGALKLFECSVQIDNLLKKQKMPEIQQLKDFENILQQTIQEIELIEDENVKKDIKLFNKQKVIELLVIIEENLEIDIVQSEEALDQLKMYIYQDKYKSLIDQLSMEIGNFDTDSALETIIKLKDKLIKGE